MEALRLRFQSAGSARDYIVGSFELGWRNVVEIAVQTLGVVPVHAAERYEVVVSPTSPAAISACLTQL